MKNCLIVDDSKVVRSFTKKILSEIPTLSVREAEDGEDALAKCKELVPDFILLDWNMPKMNGLEFLKEIRKDHSPEKLIIIFCTTESEMAKITEAIQFGASEYIMKPFDAEILKGKLIQLGIISA